MRPLPQWEEPPTPTNQAGWDRRNKDLLTYKEEVASYFNELLDHPHVQEVMNIPGDEPIFVLRAQDINAPETMNFWLGASQQIVSPGKFIAASARYQEMLEWQNVEPTRAKIPD